MGLHSNAASGKVIALTVIKRWRCYANEDDQAEGEDDNDEEEDDDGRRRRRTTTEG